MTCSVPACLRDAKVKGYCDAHYRRVRKFGDPLPDVPLTKGVLQRKPSEARVCEVCGTGFVVAKPSSRKRYCSKYCAWLARGGPEFNARVARATVQARADKQRDGGEGRSYRKRNGRHEHRIVAEQKLGRALLPGEVVHHIDGDFRNNDPDNLMVVTQAEHMRLHGLGIPGVRPAWKPWEKRWAT